MMIAIILDENFSKKKIKKNPPLGRLTSSWKRCVQFHVEIEREPYKWFAALCDR